MNTATSIRTDTTQSDAVALARRAVIAFTTGCLDGKPDDIFSPDYRAFGPARDIIGAREARPVEGLTTAFTDRRVTVHSVEPSPSGVAVRLTFRGRHTGDFQGCPPSGREMQGDGVVVFALRDGRIASGTSVLRWSPID